MAWTVSQKVDHLIRLPWTIVAEKTPEGDSLLRVVELPAAVGSGIDEKSLSDDFWESFVATLEAYIALDSVPPLPAGITSVPWAEPDPAEESEVGMLKVSGTRVIHIGIGRTAAAHGRTIAAASLQPMPLVAAGGS